MTVRPKTNLMKKKYFLIGIFFLFILMICLCIVSFLPKADLLNEKPDFYITSNELISDYLDNEPKADEKYLNKLVQISGEVKQINLTDQSSSILLVANGMSNVICQLNQNQKTNVKVGDELTLKGICTGYLMDVVLVECIIVN